VIWYEFFNTVVIIFYILLYYNILNYKKDGYITPYR
jgi:hypothetical protein